MQAIYILGKDHGPIYKNNIGEPPVYIKNDLIYKSSHRNDNDQNVLFYKTNKRKNSLNCSCEKLKNSTYSVCDVCSEKDFLKRSFSPEYTTDSSTFTDDS